jgi:hypothetical protein
MLKSNFEVEVLVHGSPVKEYYHNGKIYIEGRKGAEYSIRLKNNSARRVLAVPTVDGLSVLNGKPGNFKSQGYILDSYSSMIVDGWRVSDKEVKKFYFTDPNDSYAKRSDNGNNYGILGVAFFEESDTIGIKLALETLKELKKLEDDFNRMTMTKKDTYDPWKLPGWGVPWWLVGGVYRCNYLNEGGVGCSSSSSRSTTLGKNLIPNSTTVTQNYSVQASNTVGNDLGTGFGDSKNSSVIEVEFQRARPVPDALVEILYASRKSLEDAGVKFDSPLYTAPSSFPGEPKYCQPPVR